MGVYNIDIKYIKDVSVYKTDRKTLFIDYFCHGFGIVPSSIYYGFYYVADDIPTGFQGGNEKLTESGKGWAWKQPSGDNWYYTEKVMDNWYYYEAGF